MGGVRALAGTVLDPGPATALALVAAMLVTGALREGRQPGRRRQRRGRHVPRERRLEILRDWRVGTYGALALVFAVVFPLVVLTPLDDGDLLRAALVGHVVGRWSILPVAAAGAARPDGAGADARGRGEHRRGQRAPWPWPGHAGHRHRGAALGVGALLTLAAVPVFRRTLGGATANTFGALSQVVELGYRRAWSMWA